VGLLEPRNVAAMHCRAHHIVHIYP
jgi:hypothetical protein